MGDSVEDGRAIITKTADEIERHLCAPGRTDGECMSWICRNYSEAVLVSNELCSRGWDASCEQTRVGIPPHLREGFSVNVYGRRS